MTASPYTQLQTDLDDHSKNERMMKRNRKTVCLIYVILFSISGCNNAFFEVVGCK